MNKKLYIISLLAAVATAHAGITASPDKPGYLLNSTGPTLSYDGVPDDPDEASCCEGAGLWSEDGDLSYEWSGAVTGDASSSTATLDTTTL
jgi:hypothetical protein